MGDRPMSSTSPSSTSVTGGLPGLAACSAATVCRSACPKATRVALGRVGSGWSLSSLEVSRL